MRLSENQRVSFERSSKNAELVFCRPIVSRLDIVLSGTHFQRWYLSWQYIIQNDCSTMQAPLMLVGAFQAHLALVLHGLANVNAIRAHLTIVLTCLAMVPFEHTASLLDHPRPRRRQVLLSPSGVEHAADKWLSGPVGHSHTGWRWLAGKLGCSLLASRFGSAQAAVYCGRGGGDVLMTELERVRC